MRYLQKYLSLGFLSVVSVLMMSVSVSAADARNFNAGRIIDDAVFTNSNSMTVQGIQEFLNSKMPRCDTWGTKPSEYGGGTRAQYAASRGVSTPFTCLKDYYQNPTTGEDNYGRSIPAGAISAAQIIYNYSRQFNINPQVIIVTLQKENGMVTDEWPFPKQYREAMGFGCPDNVAPGAPACDPQYGSFSAQVYQAARHYRGYIDNSLGWYLPYTTGNNSILWNPNSACGRSTVFIENRVTAALYNYTPYRPNQAALNAQYGTGDGCSAYGNRNFYLYFSDWFGSVYGDAQIITPVTMLSSSEHGLFTSFVETSFVIRNNSSQWINVGTVATAVRDSNGRNYDFGAQQITLAPYQEYLYRAARSFDKEDQYSFWITSYREGIGWVDDYPSTINGYQRRFDNKIVQNPPTITQDPVANSELRIGKTSSISFTAVNNSKYPVNLGYIGVAVRSPSGKNSDLAFEAVSNLAPFQTYSYAKPFSPKEIGEHKAYIASTPNGGAKWYESTYPTAVNGHDGQAVLTSKDNPTVTQGPVLNIPSPRVGQGVTASFKVRNFGDSAVNVGYVGIAVRDPDGANADIGGVELGSLAASSEYTFTGNRTFHKPGVYTAWIVAYKDGWRDDYPVSESGSVLRKITFTVQPNPTLTQGPVLSIGSPRVGQSVSATFKVRNFGDSAVNVGYAGIAVRDPDGRNVDIGGADINNLASGAEYTFSGSRTFTKPGTYTAWIVSYRNGWNDTYPVNESATVSRKITFTVQPNPTITQGLSFSANPAAAGTQLQAGFTLHNYGNNPVTLDGIAVIIRKDGKNYDMPLLPVTIAPGQDYVYTASKTFTSTGVYTAWISSYNNGSWNDTDYPASDSAAITRKTTFTVQ